MIFNRHWQMKLVNSSVDFLIPNSTTSDKLMYLMSSCHCDRKSYITMY
jgi:hypothetical protein